MENSMFQTPSHQSDAVIDTAKEIKSLDSLMMVLCDGTLSNTGWDNGMIGCMGKVIKRALHRQVCTLHFIGKRRFSAEKLNNLTIKFMFCTPSYILSKSFKSSMDLAFSYCPVSNSRNLASFKPPPSYYF